MHYQSKRKTMKKLLLGIIVLSLVGTVATQAQKQNALKTSLTSIFLRTYLFSYERAINEDMSGQLGFYFSGASAGDVKFSGYTITPEFRYYLSEDKSAPNGAFVAPFLRYQTFTLEDNSGATGASADFTAFGAGLIVGTQRVFKDVIVLSAYIGPWYASPTLTYDDPNNSFEVQGIDGNFRVRTGISVGVVF